MKKKGLLIIFSIFIYLGVCLGICFYLILPGVNKIKDANNIKELTYEEKTELIDNINQKYLDLEKAAIDKYAPNIKEINERYDNLKTSINQKYDKLEKSIIDKYNKQEASINQKYNNLENSIKQKYDNLEKEINNSISSINMQINNEFMKNGFSEKYYQFRNQWSELQDQKSDLMIKESKEINDNNALKYSEISNNNSAKAKEISSNTASKNNELNTNEGSRNNELNTIEDNKTKDLGRLNKEKTKEINGINNQKDDKNALRNKGIVKIGIGIVVLLIPLLYIIVIFNRLTHLSNSVKEKWSQIDVLLKQRADLIPNVVEAIKGASTHEKSTLTKVTKARNQFLKATTKEEEISASKNLSTAINNIFILKENYPELKTNKNFMDLQDNLEEIENKISFARQIYNKAVLKYKNKLEMFPSNIIANLFGFRPELFFEADEDDKENPNIKFN